jgi:ribosomal protein L37AE/L43A
MANACPNCKQAGYDLQMAGKWFCMNCGHYVGYDGTDYGAGSSASDTVIPGRGGTQETEE